MTTLLALYRRPEGGDEALAEFERRYGAEHLPLVAETPGLRSTEVRRVAEALGPRPDLVIDHDDGPSMTERPSTPACRPMRCALPGATCARSRRA